MNKKKAGAPGERMRTIWRSAVRMVHAGVANPQAQSWYERFKTRAEKSIGTLS